MARSDLALGFCSLPSSGSTSADSSPIHLVFWGFNLEVLSESFSWIEISSFFFSSFIDAVLGRIRTHALSCFDQYLV